MRGVCCEFNFDSQINPSEIKLRAGSDNKKKEENIVRFFFFRTPTMPSPFATDMETNSQYSSCETLDSHRSSECDEKSEVNGNQKTRKVKRVANAQFYMVN